MTSIAQSERAALCDLLEEVGPDAPTLCEGWTAYDLAAHLMVREGYNPLVGLGIIAKPLAGVHDGAITRAKGRRTFAQVVAKLRAGPPLGFFKLMDAQLNGNEYFVHHEDLRRGDGVTGPRPDSEIAHLDEWAWGYLAKAGGFATRRLKGVGVTFVWPGHGEHVARRGDTTVTVTGRPTEIALYLNGRRGAAHVEIAGDAEAADAFRAAAFGV